MTGPPPTPRRRRPPHPAEHRPRIRRGQHRRRSAGPGEGGGCQLRGLVGGHRIAAGPSAARPAGVRQAARNSSHRKNSKSPGSSRPAPPPGRRPASSSSARAPSTPISAISTPSSASPPAASYETPTWGKSTSKQEYPNRSPGGLHASGLAAVALSRPWRWPFRSPVVSPSRVGRRHAVAALDCVAHHRLKRPLTALTVAGRRPVSPGICLRWLLVWLPNLVSFANEWRHRAPISASRGVRSHRSSGK